MDDRTVSLLLPALIRPEEPAFNVFDVMHHGRHEKQISNVFAWLLNAEGTHGLGDAFLQIFIDAVSRRRGEPNPIPLGAYSVSQEVDVASPGEPSDIADLVLEGDHWVLVVENYYTSDGHGHGYDAYSTFGTRGDKQSAVVLLCASIDLARLANDWHRAAVVSYAEVLGPLLERVAGDDPYQRSHPEQCAFLRHLHDHFVKESQMDDAEMIRFVDAMCVTGEAKRYLQQDAEAAASQFASDLNEQALRQFGESRAWLQKVKGTLKHYAAQVLRPQLNDALTGRSVTDVGARYAGRYQWTVTLELDGHAGDAVQLKFGPSAWYANEQDSEWTDRVSDPDYAHVFLTRRGTQQIRQSSVTLQEVLNGLAAEDERILSELLGLLDES